MGGNCALVAQLCLTLCDLTDCSPPGSFVHGILRARVLEWVAISFSKWGEIRMTLFYEGSKQPKFILEYMLNICTSNVQQLATNLTTLLHEH